MQETSAEVLIIGAGAAGLVAASDLARRGRKACVLEARDRVGGRIWTLDEPTLPLPIELGAEFIHGAPDATFELLRRHGVIAVDAASEHWSLEGGRLQPMEDYFAEIQKGLKSGRASTKDRSFAGLLESIPASRLSRKARDFAQMLVEGFDAADPARVSARSIIDEWSGAGAANAPTFRPLGGYGAVLAPLTSGIKNSSVHLQLQSVVHTIRWKRGFVEVEGLRRDQPFRVRGSRAIVTLPLGVLQLPPGSPGAVRFDPPLPAKEKAIHKLAPGPVIKVVLQFRSAFWEQLEKGRHRAASFFHASSATFPTFWTTLPMRTPVLVAWAGGPRAARLAGSDRSQILREALQSLRQIFASTELESELVTSFMHDWQQDPFARSAYSYVMVGGGRARATLAEPVQETLLFAGEAADLEDAGTVAGALESGRRAARLATR